MTATRTVTAWQATEAINCRYCAKQGRCGSTAFVLRQNAEELDDVQ